jgi:hypothetical protein
MKAKMELVWAAVTANVLDSSPLVERHSPMRLTAQGQECMKDVEEKITIYRNAHPLGNASDVLNFVQDELGGWYGVVDMAKKTGCKPSEFIALLTVKFGVVI